MCAALIWPESGRWMVLAADGLVIFFLNGAIEKKISDWVCFDIGEKWPSMCTGLELVNPRDWADVICCRFDPAEAQ